MCSSKATTFTGVVKFKKCLISLVVFSGAHHTIPGVSAELE